MAIAIPDFCVAISSGSHQTRIGIACGKICRNISEMSKTTHVCVTLNLLASFDIHKCEINLWGKCGQWSILENGFLLYCDWYYFEINPQQFQKSFRLDQNEQAWIISDH